MTRFSKRTGDVPVPRPSVAKGVTTFQARCARRVVGVEALGAEVRVDHRTVGDRCWSGEAAPAVARVEHGPVVCGAIPQDLAGLGVQGHDFEGVLLVGGHAVGVDPVLFLALTVLDGPLPGHHVSLDHGRQINAVTPDNR